MSVIASILGPAGAFEQKQLVGTRILAQAGELVKIKTPTGQSGGGVQSHSGPAGAFKGIFQQRYVKLPKSKVIYLNPSMIWVIGLYSKAQAKSGNFSLALLKGKGTAEIYINKETAKVTNTVKSRYLVVKAEIVIPKPKPIRAIINT